MLRRKLLRGSWCEIQKRYLLKNSKTTTENPTKYETAKIRNIGILAHIDAGKTTTTERMLFYAGLIKSMGEVHHGNTVTDYMDQERERGITIQSAAVTFDWKNHHINLIDTPGHIDFTMEVEQTLRVLDGAVLILDGSAGVEAQTLTVSRQADKYNIPRIIYVNKMDRKDADFDMSLASIESKLSVTTLPTQFPIRSMGVLNGIVDVVGRQKLLFNQKNDETGVTTVTLDKSHDADLWEMAQEKRRNLTEKLSNMDDILANLVIETESLDNIPPQDLVNALRRATVSRQGVPVMLGSSYKNMGVQPLLDSILFYLPSPGMNPETLRYQCFKTDLSARVFKVVHDKRKGPLSFCRVYTGRMKKGGKIYNIQRDISENCNKFYNVYADDYEEIGEISCGDIAAVAGLNSTVTGDILTRSDAVARRAKETLKKKNMPPEQINSFFAPSSKILEPVFFCSIEPPSPRTQSALDAALQELQREDPSLRVTYDEEFGQIILAGMGELHIEIIKERIRREYKIDAELGQLQVAYRETIHQPIKDTHVSEIKIGTSNYKVEITMSLIPGYSGDKVLLLDKTADSASNIAGIKLKTMQAIETGVKTALMHGPKISYPVMQVGVKLHWYAEAKSTPLSIVSAAVSQCIRKMFEQGGSTILEPIMHVEIVTGENYNGKVLADLSKKRAQINAINVRGSNKVIIIALIDKNVTSLTNVFYDQVVDTHIPLSELVGYSTTLRIITSGHGTFSQEFSHYQSMEPSAEAEAIRRVSGF